MPKKTDKPKPENISGQVANLMSEAETCAQYLELMVQKVDLAKVAPVWKGIMPRQVRRTEAAVKALRQRLQGGDGPPAKVVKVNPKEESWPRAGGRGVIPPNSPTMDKLEAIVDDFGFTSVTEALGVIAAEKEEATKKEAPELAHRFGAAASSLVGASFELTDLEV